MEGILSAVGGFATALVILGLVRLVFVRDKSSVESRLFLLGGAAAVVGALALAFLDLRDPPIGLEFQILTSTAYVAIALNLSSMIHFSFLFPLRVPLPAWAVPLVYVPLMFSIVALPFVQPYSPWITSIFLGTVFLFISWAMVLVRNMVRSRRLMKSAEQRQSTTPLALGIIVAIVIAAGSAFPDYLAGPLQTVSLPSAVYVLPPYLGIAYSMLRYRLFDLELLKRRLAVATVAGSTVCTILVLGMVGLGVALGPSSPIAFLPFLALFAWAVGFSARAIESWSTRVVERIVPGLKWKEGRPEEAYVIHRSGIVVAHRDSPGGSHSVDADIVGSMITAVQDFVRDSFAGADPGKLRTVNLGRVKLMLEHGKDVTVAVVFSGYETEEMRDDMQRIVKEIEHEHSERLAKWDGRSSGLESVEALLAKLWPEEGTGGSTKGRLVSLAASAGILR